ncbi:YIP1 family protein [Haloarchaeobius sp. HME9146]|uniref:YIP1 family protein n=1 Tax=Haloarchaeobius sp. HME9146 TaxID=2978732 RepID=UPI0021C0BA7E|nr:YIP1 family protein [Haloarchaeobius sp. HME9146]MCT9095705.1 YIP1 family protein [Haloarchaeobius sp. HME9146]
MSLRDLLVDPAAFFAPQEPGRDLGAAFVAVLLSTLVVTGAAGAMLYVASTSMTGTVTVDNPERPPDWVCSDDYPMGNDSAFADDCDKPKTLDRDAGALFWEVASGQLPVLFVGLLFMWPLVGVGLHFLTALGGGEGSFTRTLAVAGWGFVPNAIGAVVGAVVVSAILAGKTFQLSNPDTFVREFRAVFGGTLGAALLVLRLGATAWQATIWGYGLERARHVSRAAGFAAAGIVAGIVFLFSL